MKKLTALLLSVVLVLSLAACGSANKACIFHHAARNLCADRTARHGTVRKLLDRSRRIRAGDPA